MNGTQENLTLEFVPNAIAPIGIDQKEKNHLRYLQYREAHPGRAAENHRRWKQRNIAKIRADTKKWREDHREEVYRRIGEYRKEHRDHLLAMQAVKDAMRTGILLKPNVCSKCGKENLSKNIHGHHDDYAKQLEVIWLCRKCHYKQHHPCGVNMITSQTPPASSGTPLGNGFAEGKHDSFTFLAELMFAPDRPDT